MPGVLLLCVNCRIHPEPIRGSCGRIPAVADYVQKEEIMKTILSSTFACLLMTGAAHAEIVVALDFASTGNYSDASATVVSTSQTIGTTGSFDINYTLGAIASGANPFVRSNGSQMGVGSDTDIPQHYLTLEGDDAEGIAFYNLSIDNFVAGDSGLVIGDITDLQFASLTFNNVANANDGVNISFSNFGVDTANQNLNAGNTGGTPYTLDLTTLSNFSATADGLYAQNDGGQSNNRWAIEGIEASYAVAVAVPEPSSLMLLGLGAVGIAVRRRRNRSVSV